MAQQEVVDAAAAFGDVDAEATIELVAAAIASKRTSLSPDDAKELAVRAARFIKERERPPSITSADAWERRLAEGAAAFMRFKKEGRYDG